LNHPFDTPEPRRNLQNVGVPEPNAARVDCAGLNIKLSTTTHARGKDTPVEIANKLNKEIQRGPRRSNNQGQNVPLMLSPVDFGKLVAAETEKWAKAVRTANIRAE
jgi:hypothetical protein